MEALQLHAAVLHHRIVVLHRHQEVPAALQEVQAVTIPGAALREAQAATIPGAALREVQAATIPAAALREAPA